MAKTLPPSLTVETMRGYLQDVGFRADIVTEGAGAPLIRSASNGVSFEARLFNPLPGQPDAYADLTLTTGLQLQTPLSVEIVNRWNATKRFGRLYVVQGMLVLALDVLLVEANAEAYLRTQLGLWDRLIQELLIYLRTAADEAARRPAGAAAKAGKGQKPAEGTVEAVPEVEAKPALANGHDDSMVTNVPPELQDAAKAHGEAGGATLQ